MENCDKWECEKQGNPKNGKLGNKEAVIMGKRYNGSVLK